MIISEKLHSSNQCLLTSDNKICQHLLKPTECWVLILLWCVLQHVWDELDRWHCRLMLLENEVQDLAEDYPDQAHQLIDQLTQPRQLYQDTAQLAEQRTAFLSKVRQTMSCNYTEM